MKDQTLPSLLKFSDRITLVSAGVMVGFAIWLWFYLAGLTDNPDSSLTAEDWRSIGGFAVVLLLGYCVFLVAWAAMLLFIKPRPSIRLPQSLLLFLMGTVPVFLGLIGFATGDNVYEMMEHVLDYRVVFPYIFPVCMLWVAAAWGKGMMSDPDRKPYE